MTQRRSATIYNPIVGKKKPMKSLAAYQKDSIISTRLIHKPTGNVTFFAFDKGQELSEHAAPFDALVTVFDGTVMIRVGKKNQKLKSGDTIILPAHVPHAVKALTRFKMMLTLIRS